MPNIQVDEYIIGIDRSTGFATVVVTFKDDDGKVHGPFEFVPAYAHKLSDELCIATARATQKDAGGERVTDAPES